MIGIFARGIKAEETNEEMIMNIRVMMLLALIAGFGALTIAALLDVGYMGILAPHFQSWGGAQVFADLVILALLSCIWMISDARAKGGTAWPYVVITLVLGSFGVLFYLLARTMRESRSQAR